jgi:hypothetical protein
MLAFSPLRAVSTLEDEVERLTLDASFVLMLVVTIVREASMLDDELESCKLDA